MQPTPGITSVNGIEVRYMPASEMLLKKPLKFIDDLGLMSFFEKLSFDPVSGTRDPPNILASGPKGVGKSLMFANWAQKNDVPYYSVDCSEETKERHLKGSFVGRGSETPFVLGTAAAAIMGANEHGVAMLVLEEINALSPQMQKLLNPLTDFRRKLEIQEISWRLEVREGATLIICGSRNSLGYGGTYDLNEDLKSRFLEISIPYPPAAMEKRILRETAPAGMRIEIDHLDLLVRIAQQTRQDATNYSLSPRDLTQAVSLIHRVGWSDALFMLGQKFAEEDRAVILSQMKDITKMEIHSSITRRAESLGALQRSVKRAP